MQSCQLCADSFLEVHDQTKTGLSGDPCEGHSTEGAKVWCMDFRGGGGSVPSHTDMSLAEAAVLGPWNKTILRFFREEFCEEIAEHFVC